MSMVESYKFEIGEEVMDLKTRIKYIVKERTVDDEYPHPLYWCSPVDLNHNSVHFFEYDLVAVGEG